MKNISELSLLVERLQKFDNLLSRIPILSGWTPIARMFTALAIAVSCIVIPFAIFMQPTLPDRLEYFRGSWCVEQITINGRDTIPVTHGITLQFQDAGPCIGNMSMDYSSIRFPGLNTYAGSAQWLVVNDQLIVELADENAKIFEGKYSVDIRGEVISLTSKDVHIRAHVVKIRLPF